MEYRNLGGTDLKVSALGFGTWAIGGNQQGAIGYGPTDDQESLSALETAFNHGINFFDTSDLYGFGKSEHLLGEAFSRKRDKVIIASKFGFLNFEGEQEFSPSYMRKALEESLKRLNTDYIDIYQLHSPPISILKDSERLIEALLKVKSEGLIKHIGISLKNPSDVLDLAFPELFASVQVNFNLTDQRFIELDGFNWCEKNKLGIIARSPLCYGFLTNLPTPKHFHPDDNRAKWSQEQRKLWQNAYHIFSDLFPEDQSAVSRCLNFCISYDSISSVIPSMLTSSQVLENVRAINNDYRPKNGTKIQLHKRYSDQQFMVSH